MALHIVAALENTGMDVEFPLYVSLQNIVVRQMRRRDGVTFWEASAAVVAHASREAKHADARPLETSHIACDYNPNNGSPHAALYAALRTVKKFTHATDV